MSDTIFSFRPAPSYRTALPGEAMEAALDMPMSRTATFFDQAKGGVLESFGLGTAIRELSLPAEAPETITRDMVVSNPTVPPSGRAGLLERRRQEAGALSEDAYKSSAYFRDEVPWDAGMTEDRAAALATMSDAKKVREFYAEKRPITSFIANLTGQAIDPINYIPIAGPAVKAAAVARLGKVAGASVTASLDAAANTAIFGIGTAPVRRKFGDDTSWQATVSQIATAALIGAGFGALGGALDRSGPSTSRSTIEARLATLKTMQEARIALNEGIDALARGEDVRLSPNVTGPVARIAAEVDGISRAYDRSIADVRAGVAGDRFDPIVQVTPEDIEGSFVARGGYKGKGDIEVRGAGYGLVKFALKHGELSSKPAGDAITKQDILDFPNVIREFEPIITNEGGVVRRNWVVEKPDGRRVVYGDRPIAERGGERGLVTVHVEKGRELSARRSPGEPSKGSTGDTDPASFARSPDRPALPTTANIARNVAVDNSMARADPPPAGLEAAAKAVAKPDNYKALSSQYRVDPETGAFVEEAEIAQLGAEGRLTDEDVADLAAARETYDNGAAYGEALKSLASCLI